MSRLTVEFEVSNYGDVLSAAAGHLAASDVRMVKMKGVVGSGAMKLVLPESVGKQLGLPISGQALVHFADQRTAQRVVANDAYVQLMGRSGVFHAILEPNRTDALLGAIVMEDLDLIVDCCAQKLQPRDPHALVTEIG